MHIAVDMDDVLVDFVGMICETVSRDFNVVPPITKDDITDWNFGQFLDQYIGQDWWAWLEENASIWGAKARPIPGAIGAIAQLRRDGHRLEILTSKPPWAERFVFSWLDKYAPKINGVTLVPLNGNKTEWTDAAVLVDDREKNVVEWVESKKWRRAILFPAPHNAGFNTAPFPRITRVRDWNEIVHMVRRGYYGPANRSSAA